MFANFIEVFLLSVVQGVSEFIPVSSSAHLFLISEIYQFKSQALMLDISLHLGSLLAIIFYFHKDLSNILNDKKLFLSEVLSEMSDFDIDSSFFVRQYMNQWIKKELLIYHAKINL